MRVVSFRDDGRPEWEPTAREGLSSPPRRGGPGDEDGAGSPRLAGDRGVV